MRKRENLQNMHIFRVHMAIRQMQYDCAVCTNFMNKCNFMSCIIAIANNSNYYKCATN